MNDRKILVTGGAGFLGSHFVKLALSSGADKVVNLDALTYAGDTDRLADVAQDPRYTFIKSDITSAEQMKQAIAEAAPEVIVHYAAESHVTRSEDAPQKFHHTNVEGTRVLLEAALSAGVSRFVHISTDEVYGSIDSGSFKETDKPKGIGDSSSPYAQSKALADDLAISYADRLEVVVARPTNAFGPWQFPEKAFPRWVTRGLRGEPLLVWGDGLYIRQWLFAEDFASAIGILVESGVSGEAYNVGPLHKPEITNIALVRWLVDHMGLPEDSIEMTAYDRPDHDRRYAVDPSKITQLGWNPGEVWEQLAGTVDWYRANEKWWRTHVDEAESIYNDSVKA